MQLTIHRQKFGVTPHKEWFEKIDGEWISIPAPEWSKREAKAKAKSEKVIDLNSMRMAPPKGKKNKPKDVKVYRVIERTVPDHEAEVLCRNGWQDYYPGTLRHNDTSALP